MHPKPKVGEGFGTDTRRIYFLLVLISSTCLKNLVSENWSQGPGIKDLVSENWSQRTGLKDLASETWSQRTGL